MCSGKMELRPVFFAGELWVLRRLAGPLGRETLRRSHSRYRQEPQRNSGNGSQCQLVSWSPITIEYQFYTKNDFWKECTDLFYYIYLFILNSQNCMIYYYFCYCFQDICSSVELTLVIGMVGLGDLYLNRPRITYSVSRFMFFLDFISL